MQKSLAELKNKCSELSLDVIQSGRRVSKKDYIKVLQAHYIKERIRAGEILSPGFRFRMDIETPQLAFLGKNLRPEERKLIEESLDWIYEEKLNGARMLVFYHPDWGFEFYGRNLSVTDFLPVNYTNKVFLHKVKTYKGLWKPFVLDCEIVSNDPRISTEVGKRGVVTETILQAVTALLALNSEDSLRIQEELGGPLELRVFDCLQFEEKDIRKMPYYKRRKALQEVVNSLQRLDLPFYKVKAVRKNKKEYLEHLWENGKEGAIAKPIAMPYLDRESRPRDGWVKLKRTVSGAIGDTVDGFITGFEEGNSKKGFAGLVGALEVTVFVKEEDESLTEHVIAKVPNIPFEMRREISGLENGKVVMDKSLYKKVVEVEGQSVSARVKRLVHPQLVRFREDKSWTDCVISREDLENQIM